MIEKPIRYGFKSQSQAAKAKWQQYVTGILIILMIAVGYVGWNTYEREGLGGRSFNAQVPAEFFDSDTLNAELNSSGRKIKNFMYDCDFYHFSDFALAASSLVTDQVPSYCYSYNPAIANTVFLWGDSHAQMLYYGLTKNWPSNAQLLQVARAGCKPSITATNDPICNATNTFALKEIKKIHSHTVILAQRDSWDPAVAAAMTEQLHFLGVKQILLIGKSPEWKSPLPKIVLRKFALHTHQRSFALLDMANYQADNKAKEMIEKTVGQARFVSINDFFCNNEGCLIYIGDNPKLGLTSFDGNHLSPLASNQFAKERLIPLIFSQPNQSQSPGPIHNDTSLK